MNEAERTVRAWTTASEDETVSLGAALGRLLRAGDWVCLSGELGAGKTRFVRGLAQGMGIDPARVHSPTFVLAHLYPPAAPGAPALAHIDAYRLTFEDDLSALGLDSMQAAGAAFAVEWPERIGAALPPDRLDVLIAHAPDHARSISLAPRGADWRSRLVDLRFP